jgi:hypothetical protein
MVEATTRVIRMRRFKPYCCPTRKESKVPYLVMDADSSQFSTLVDVADGKNVAVEGPPGSNKCVLIHAEKEGIKNGFEAEKSTQPENHVQFARRS